MFRKTLVTLCMLFVLLSALSIPAFADYDTIRIYGAVEKLDGTDSRPVYAVMMTEQGGADISAYIICRKGSTSEQFHVTYYLRLFHSLSDPADILEGCHFRSDGGSNTVEGTHYCNSSCGSLVRALGLYSVNTQTCCGSAAHSDVNNAYSGWDDLFAAIWP